MRNLWNGNSASNPDGRILISWNEIGENSHVKPLQKWGSTYVNVLYELIKGGKMYDDKSSILIYSSGWEDALDSPAYLGSFKRTLQNGSYVKLVFTGTSFSVIYRANLRMSKFDVYIDGQLAITLNENLTT